MDMPQVTDAHRRLHALAGLWTGIDKMHPSPWDPKGGEAVARMSCRVGASGFVVLADYEQIRDGKVTYTGHGVFGYDARTSQYRMSWFDAMGGWSQAVGKFSGDALTLEEKNPMMSVRYTYTFVSASELTFTLASSQDGKTWAPFVDARYHRAAM